MLEFIFCNLVFVISGKYSRGLKWYAGWQPICVTLYLTNWTSLSNFIYFTLFRMTLDNFLDRNWHLLFIYTGCHKKKEEAIKKGNYFYFRLKWYFWLPGQWIITAQVITFFKVYQHSLETMWCFLRLLKSTIVLRICEWLIPNQNMVPFPISSYFWKYIYDLEELPVGLSCFKLWWPTISGEAVYIWEQENMGNVKLMTYARHQPPDAIGKCKGSTKS